jgi:hypothetical protein
LFFSGPGAGPDITAATILDDAIEAVSTARRFARPTPAAAPRAALVAPITEWFVRVRFPGVVPDATAASALFSAAGLSVLQATTRLEGPHWLRMAAASAHDVTRAIGKLSHTHRIDCHAIRSLS